MSCCSAPAGGGAATSVGSACACSVLTLPPLEAGQCCPCFTDGDGESRRRKQPEPVSGKRPSRGPTRPAGAERPSFSRYTRAPVVFPWSPWTSLLRRFVNSLVSNGLFEVMCLLTVFTDKTVSFGKAGTTLIFCLVTSLTLGAAPDTWSALISVCSLTHPQPLKNNPPRGAPALLSPFL